MQNVAEQVTNFRVTLNDDIIEASKIAFLDTINALVLGMQEREIKQLSVVLQKQNVGIGSTAVLGSNVQLPLLDAAFLLGAASVAVELDEGNQWSKGHPAVHVFPILLLHAQNERSYDGRKFVEDFVKSYEVATYFGKITTLKPSLHAHGTWGVLGSAATFGLLHRISSQQMQKLLNVAATFASPTQWAAAIEGAIVRNIYMSESIVGGIRAWQLLQAGIEAPRNNAVAIFTDILGTEFDTTKPLSEGQYAIQKNYYKFHAFCRYVHVPIEAFQYLFTGNALDVNSIERVEVKTYMRAATLANQTPTNTLGAKFSIPFAIAAWAHTNRTDHGVFTEQYLNNEEICNFAKKIFVEHDAQCDENYPNVMPAKVKIYLTDGTIFAYEQDAAKGGPNEKANFDQIVQKFSENTENILTKQCQDKVIAFAQQLVDVENVGDIIGIINNGLKGE